MIVAYFTPGDGAVVAAAIVPLIGVLVGIVNHRSVSRLRRENTQQHDYNKDAFKEGLMNLQGTVATGFVQVNGRLDTIDTRVTNLDSRVDGLQSNVASDNVHEHEITRTIVEEHVDAPADERLSD